MIFLVEVETPLRDAIKEAAVNDSHFDSIYGTPKSLLPLKTTTSLDLLLNRLSMLKEDIRIIANTTTYY
jgi:hypothetical protein